MKKSTSLQDLPEKLHYTKYYEHDGLLRAYANRAMALAMLLGVIALGSLSLPIYVRLQPPTVVLVEPSGEASAVRTASNTDPDKAKLSFHVAAANETEPTELEARACVRRFLEAYLNYSPGIAELRFAE